MAIVTVEKEFYMHKKILAILIATLATVGAFAGGEGEDAAADSEQFVELDMMVWGIYPIDEDDRIMAMLEEQFNADINLQVLQLDTYPDQVNLRLAAGDFPDYFRSLDLTLYDQLLEDGMLTNISEYVTDLGLQNLQNHLGDSRFSIKSTDEGFYSLPVGMEPFGHALFIRKDWLDQLGLEMPTTLDEYRDVLAAFVENDPDGRGTTGITGGSFWMYLLRSAFTGIFEFGTYEGEWMADFMHPDYRDYLRYAKGLYDDGLLDQEYLTITGPQAIAKFTSGRAGVLPISGKRWDQLEDALADFSPTAELELFTPLPAGPAGAPSVENIGYYGWGMIPEQTPEADKVRVLELLDYMLTPEGIELTWHGIPGVHFDLNAGSYQYDVSQRDVEFKDMPMHMLVRTIDYQKLEEFQPPRVVDNYARSRRDGLLRPRQWFTTENLTNLWTGLSQVHADWEARFITGDADIDADWDQFMADLERAGYSEYQAEAAVFYEEKLGAVMNN